MTFWILHLASFTLGVFGGGLLIHHLLKNVCLRASKKFVEELDKKYYFVEKEPDV
jgi:hypothetical protein